MRKKTSFVITTLIFCVAIFGVACTHKSLPEITSRRTESLKKDNSTKAVIPDMNIGKTVFISRCGKCHDLPLPEQFTAQRWEGILSYMIPKARLNNEQGVHVTAYLKANALK